MNTNDNNINHNAIFHNRFATLSIIHEENHENSAIFGNNG